MAFISCSDEELSVDVIVFPKVYDTLPNFKKGDIIKVEGRVERRKDYDIIADSIINMKESLKMELYVALEVFFSKMEEDIWVYGKIIKWMDMVI